VLVLNDGGLTELPEETATPGTAVPWVYDVGRAEVLRLTPDGRRRRTGYFDGATLNVVADPDSGFVLAVDFFAGRIVLLDRDAREMWRQENFERPNAGLRVPGGWWVTDSGLASVRRIDDAGEPVYESFEFGFPLDLAASTGTAVWVADGEGRVGRLVPGQGIVAQAELASPRILAPAPDGGVWVADREAAALIRLDVAAVEVLRLENFPVVEALAADPVTGGVWVGDRGRRRLTLLDASGQEELGVAGFPDPGDIAVSPDGQEIWVADPLLGEVFRVARTGEILARSEGLSSPVALSVAFR
jgi:DNA-binding beta-propeller fold protein YncE